MKHKKNLLTLIFAIACLTVPFFLFAGEVAPFNPYTTEGVNIDDLTLVRADVFSTLSSIINYALSFLGMISLILMMYAGILWMLARGNEEQITKAREILKGGFIGLVIILSSYALSYFVFTNLVSIVTNTALPS